MLIVVGLLFGRHVDAPVTPHIPPAGPAPQSASPDTPTLFLGEEAILLDIADTEAKQELGLGGRESLLGNRGMLFVFETSGFMGIWMKGMHFSLDILWLKEANDASHLVVVDMQENVSPGTYPKVFYPRASASYVLEMGAGAVAEHGITVGSVLTLKK